MTYVSRPLDDRNIKTGRYPRSLAQLLVFEATDRFGFYGLQGILLIYLIQGLNFPEASANLTMASFNGLSSVATLFGGAIAGRLISVRSTVALGAAMQCFALSYLAWSKSGIITFLIGLAFVAIANGLTRPNTATLVSGLILPGKRSDELFTWYAFAVNLGAGIAFFIVPYVAKGQWTAGFGLCALSAGIGLLSILYRPLVAKSGITAQKTHHSSGMVSVLLSATITGIATLGVYVLLQKPLYGQLAFLAANLLVPLLGIRLWLRCSPLERRRFAIALVLIAQAMFYMIFDEQTTSSFVLLALHDVGSDFHLGKFVILRLSDSQFVAVNAGLTMAFAPLIAHFYHCLDRAGYRVPLHTKYLMGSIFIVLSVGILWLQLAFQTSSRLSPWSLATSYAFISIAGLLMSSLGLAVIAEYIPRRFNSISTAMYYICTGVTMYYGGRLSNALALHRLTTKLSTAEMQSIFTILFAWLTGIAILGCCLFVALQPLLSRWERNLDF